MIGNAGIDRGRNLTAGAWARARVEDSYRHETSWRFQGRCETYEESIISSTPR
jgi:hypothetical protein